MTVKRTGFACGRFPRKEELQFEFVVGENKGWTAGAARSYNVDRRSGRCSDEEGRGGNLSLLSFVAGESARAMR